MPSLNISGLVKFAHKIKVYVQLATTYLDWQTMDQAWDI